MVERRVERQHLIDGGSIRVEMLDLDGQVLLRSELLTGDELRKTVTWHGEYDLTRFAGKPMALR